jgi:SAM-dependent methyltransferase
MATISRRQIEELSLLYGWDEVLTALASSLDRTELAHFISSLASTDQDGWTFLLPNLPADAAVLCFDARFGTTAIAISEWAGEVTVVHPCKTTVDIIEYRLRQSGITNVRVLHASPESDSLPFDDAQFDAVIHHDVTGFLPRNPPSANWAFATASPHATVEVGRVLRDGGFLYYGVRNPLGYSAWKNLLRGRWRDFFTPPATGYRLQSIRRALSRSGFKSINTHPYLLTQEHVCEVLPEDGYKSSKNSLLFRETLKELLLGRFGARILAPAYGFIASKGTRPLTVIDKLAGVLIENRLLAANARSQVNFLRYIVLPGKAFITLGQRLRSPGNIVAVLPRYPRFIDGRRKELTIVDDLKSAAPQVGRLLPAEYKELSLSGRPIFAMSEIQGITVDRAMPAVTALTRNALDFLVGFHKSTSRSICVDENSYARLFGVIIDQARAGYPGLSPNIDRLDGLIRKAVLGETIITCWLHGDFKLENLIFDSSSLSITGVIDWEHSRKEGLPWLDFLYLIAYNRITKDEADFFSVFQNNLLNQRLTGFESSLLRTYTDAIPIKPSLRPTLLAMFFLHHIAFRYKYNMSKATDRNKLLTSLALISGELISRSLMHCPSGSA